MKSRTSGVPDRPAVSVAATDGLTPTRRWTGVGVIALNAPVASLVGVSDCSAVEAAAIDGTDPKKEVDGTESLGLLVGVGSVGCRDTYRRPVRNLGERGAGRI